MITITYRDLVSTQNEIEAVFDCRPKQGGDALRLTLVKRKINNVLEEYQDAANKLAESWGHEDPEKPGAYHFNFVDDEGKKVIEYDENKKDDEGNVIVDLEGHPILDFKKFSGYRDALEELRNTEVEIDIKPLDIEALKRYEYKDLPSVNQLARVFFLFEQGQEFFQGQAKGVTDEDEPDEEETD